jgi:glycine oxidase
LETKSITVAGAGILGVWQALTLAKAGHKVRLVEASTKPFSQAASRWAGAMLAPDCEAESAPAVVRDLGREAMALWRSVYPGIVENGTLVVASARDQSELQRFARATERHRKVDESSIADLEPSLGGRFQAGLFFADEAHFDAMAALGYLLEDAKRAGVAFSCGEKWLDACEGLTIDCRGFSARDDLKDLRGVRGERLVVRSTEVALRRPVRLLHPRQPIYVVPQGDGRFVVGATVVEREDDGPMTVRSALELLGSAYALHPAFAEAEVLDMGAGVRPAFPDNVPRIEIADEGRLIRVNGAYRHGFLLAPVLAAAVEHFLATGTHTHPLIAT